MRSTIFAQRGDVGWLRVSRGPVREALLRLEREGLVSSEWHRCHHAVG
jgi:DNA-binding PadR family transcriptional regulator